MSQIPDDLVYTKSHEWVRLEGDLARVGITDFAQHELGDVVFVELPAPGQAIRAGERFGTIESVKAASDLYAPVSGEVVEANPFLQDAPQSVNDAPYGAGWMLVVRLSQPEQVEQLLKPPAYASLLNAH